MGRPVEDECIHGITTAFCSYCKAKNTRPERMRRQAWRAAEAEANRPEGNFIRAKYEGWCVSMRHCRIEEDDWIQWSNDLDGWVCVIHAEHQDEAHRAD